MRKNFITEMENKLEGWALIMGEPLPAQWTLYAAAKEDLKKGLSRSDAVCRVYENEENRISKGLVHSAKTKLRARLRAHLILALLLLDDDCEDAAVDSILEAIEGTHRVRQIKMSALLKHNSQ